MNPGVVLHLPQEDGLGIAGVLIEILPLGDDADADQIIGEGQIPEPALLRQISDGRGALSRPGSRFAPR